MKLTVTHERETIDPKLHLTIDPQARTMISAQMSLPYLGGLAFVMRRTQTAEADASAITPSEENPPNQEG